MLWPSISLPENKERVHHETEISPVLTFAAVFSMASRCAGNVLIINNGVPEVSIVTTPVPSSTEQHAARELAEFLDKVTSCGKIDIGQSAVPGKCPIRFVRTTAGEIQPEGFALEVSDNEIKILENGDIGFLWCL